MDVKHPPLPHQDHAQPAQGSARAPDLSAEAWEKEKEVEARRAWRDTPLGRGMIRLVSRGVMGATAFAVAIKYGGSKMETYAPDRPVQNWLQGVGRFFDVAVGKPISFIAGKLGYDGKRAVTFRPTRHFGGYGDAAGRSLGHEVVMVTLDFAAMGVSDAVGRDIADILDPNIKKSWIKDGHVDWGKAIPNFGKAVWRYLSYNQGEDWAVAVPYVYYLRAQRNLINKFSPGFGFDSDRQLNGGSFKVDDHGRVMGNYQAEGMLDLQGRFTAYNVGTLMFREAYAYTGDKLKKLFQGKPVVDWNNIHPLQTASDLVKWGVRDTIKGTLYMTPAVPFFWLTRSPQSKYKGLFIHPEKGPMAYMPKAGALAPVNVGMEGPKRYRSGDASGLYEDASPEAVKRPWLVTTQEPTRASTEGLPKKERFNEHTPVFFNQFDEASRTWSKKGIRTNNPFLGLTDLERYPVHEQTYGKMDAALNPLGAFNNWVRRKLHKAGHVVERDFGIKIPKRMSDNYINAAFAYTPYFYMKAETARLWDTPQMDVSIERVIDGAAHLKPGEFTAGIGEMWQSFWRKPLADPKRAAYVRQREEQDLSPADTFTEDTLASSKHVERVKRSAEAAPAAASDWRERVVQGRAEDQYEIAADKPTTFAEQEAMREALKTMVPPTKSIH